MVETRKRFVELAEEIRATGRKKYSAEAIINVLRWEHDLKTDGDFFKINDHYRSIYVRLLIYKRPEFLGFFTLKNYE